MFNVTNILQNGGLFILALIIFAESGMLVGFFFPGDTLLFSAGILAAAGKLNIIEVLFVVAIAAILGDNVGYQIGKRLGPSLFKKDSAIFRKEYIDRARAFFAKNGSKTMLLAHFVPVVRTFAPVVAGASAMPIKQFALFDAIGDIAWTLVVTLAGYFIGSRIPGVEKYIDPVLVGVILLFLIPTVVHVARDPKMRAGLKSALHRRNKS